MNVWQFISNKQSSSINVVLLYVLKSEGSSPGRQGFAMAVSADGDFFGTIGGGIMEHKFVEMARAELREHTVGSDIYKQVHDKAVAKNQSGMICSGEQTIFFYHIQKNDLTHVNALISSLDKNKNGSLQLTKDSIHFSKDIPSTNYFFEQKNEDEFLFVEVVTRVAESEGEGERCDPRDEHDSGTLAVQSDEVYPAQHQDDGERMQEV